MIQVIASLLHLMRLAGGVHTAAPEVSGLRFWGDCLWRLDIHFFCAIVCVKKSKSKEMGMKSLLASRKLFFGAFVCMLLGTLYFTAGCSSDGSDGSEPSIVPYVPQNVSQQVVQGDFVFEKNDGKTAALVAYSGRAAFVNIPPKVGDCLVTSIGKTDGSGLPVFKNHTEITGINIPQSIHYIGAESFRNTGLTQVAVPGHVQYIGKDCFKDCKSLQSIFHESTGEHLYAWDKDWNSDNVQTFWGQNVMDAENGIEFIAKTIAGAFVSKGAEKVAEVTLNSILSLFGYKSPEEQFREETLKTLAEIQDAITKGMSNLSAQIKEISDKITGLKDYVDGMEREIFAKVDRTEFDTRMTVVGKDIATVDTLYEKYQRAISETKYDVAKETVTQLVSDIEKTDLLSIITYLQNEMAASAAGSQTPIITLYFTYTKDVYPFMHQAVPKLDAFAKYCQMEMLKAVQLYTEYANYEQALYSSDSAKKTVWQQDSAAALKSFNSALDAIDKLLPQGDFTLKTDDTTYHIVTVDDAVNFYFTSKVRDCSEICERDDIDDGCNPYYYPWDTKVTRADYKHLNDMRVRYDAASSLLDFINKNTGANIQTQLWGCQSEWYDFGRHQRYFGCPCIWLYDLDAQEDYTYPGSFVPVWK